MTARLRTIGRTREGMTLIEVLVVITLIALATGAATLSLGAVTRTKLRSACMRVVAAASFAYNRSIADGNTLRLLIDMESHTLSVQQASGGKITLARQDDRRGMQSGDDHDEAAVDPWAAARSRLEDSFKPSFGRSPFGPLTDRDGNALARYRDISLGDGIRVVRLHVPHEREPRETGMGSIYFFPSGLTEHAVVHLTDGSGDIYAVEIHPLTGRGKVHDFPFEPAERSLEEGFSEVRDR
jgi:general secretion pathway protein H